MAGLTVAGLLLRLLAAYYFIGLLGIAPLDVGSDAVQYHNLALGIMRGDWSDWMFLARPPLQPLLMAGVYALAGVQPLAVTIVHAMLGGLTAGLTYLLALQLNSSPRAALVAGAIVALDPASVVINVTLLTETLATFWLGLGMLALVRASCLDSLRLSLLAGACFGLSALARPTVIYLPVAALPLCVALFRRWLRHYLALAGVMLVFVVGWAARNFQHTGQFTFSSVGDFNLLFYRAVAIERRATGDSADAIQRRFAYEVERRLGTGVAPEQIDSGYFWKNFAPDTPARAKVIRQMALEVFRSRPVYYFVNIPIGLFRMFAYTNALSQVMPLEIPLNAAFYILAAWGVWRAWRQREIDLLALTLTLIGYYTLVTMISQTSGMDTRMRTAITPPLAILAADGLLAVRQRLRAGRLSGRQTPR